MVTTTTPGVRIGSGEQRFDFRSCQKADQSTGIALTRNGQYTLNLLRPGWRLEGRIAEKGADGSQPEIATARGDSATLFQVVEKGNDQRRIDLFE